MVASKPDPRVFLTLFTRFHCIIIISPIFVRCSKTDGFRALNVYMNDRMKHIDPEIDSRVVAARETNIPIIDDKALFKGATSKGVGIHL